MPLLALVLLPLVIAVAGDVASVPLHLEHDRPFIDLQFTRADGTPRMARFWVDTGGGGFILKEGLAKDLGLRLGTAVTEGEERYAPIPAPPQVKVGDMPLDLRDARCLVMLGDPQSFAGVTCEGLFPGHVLRRYHVIFDYPARSFTLAKPGVLEPHGTAIPSPISEGPGFPRIELEIGGKKHGFLLDTGASFTMISMVQLKLWAQEHPDWKSTEGAVGRANMMGGPMEQRALLMRLPDVKLGSTVLKDIGAVSRPPGTFEGYMTSMMTAPIIGAVGGNVWRRFRVEIDYQKGTTYLEYSPSQPPDEFDHVGLVLRWSPRGYLIDGVARSADPDTIAAVKTGDLLLRVDELDATTASLSHIIDALRGTPGEEHTVLIQRGGTTQELTLKVAHLL